MKIIEDLIKTHQSRPENEPCRFTHLCDFFLVNAPRQGVKIHKYLDEYCHDEKEAKKCVHYQKFIMQEESVLPYDIAPDGMSIL